MGNLKEAFISECTKQYNSCKNVNPVKDEFVALISFSEKKFIMNTIISKDEDGRPKERDKFKRMEIENNNAKTLAIIVESPHIDEYDYRNNPIGPAMGTTGRNINNKIIEKFELEETYKLVFVEAVSYQCSAGNSPIEEQKRDEVFKAVWHNGGKEDFVARLKKISPDIILNACTGGMRKIDSGSSLNSLVQKKLIHILMVLSDII